MPKQTQQPQTQQQTRATEPMATQAIKPQLPSAPEEIEETIMLEPQQLEQLAPAELTDDQAVKPHTPFVSVAVSEEHIERQQPQQSLQSELSTPTEPENIQMIEPQSLSARASPKPKS